MDRIERARRLRDEYEAALDQAERRRAEYRREIVELHRSGMSLRDIAERLGISHQRVHQIVGGEETRKQRRSRRVGRSIVAAMLLVFSIGLGFLFVRRALEPGDTETRASVSPTSRSDIVLPSRCTGRAAIVVMDPRTGEVLAMSSGGLPAGRRGSTFGPLTLAAALAHDQAFIHRRTDCH